MVDWQSPQTVSIPSLNIQKIMILQRRAELIDTRIQYDKLKYNGTENQNVLAELKAKLNGLIWEIDSMLERKYENEWKTDENKKEWQDFLGKKKKLIESQDDKDFDECLKFINKFLDVIQITPVDIRRKIEPADIEGMNQYKDL